MKFLRVLLKILLGLVILVLLLLAVSLSPNDHTPYRQTDFYRQTTARLAALPNVPTAKTPLRAG